MVLTVEEHPFFRRDHNDLHCEVPVSFVQAALGTELVVPTLEGTEKLRLPEGTQPGTVLRLRGRGVMSLRGHGRGDQFVKIRVTFPKRLSREQRELLLQLDTLEKSSQDNEGFFGKVAKVVTAFDRPCIPAELRCDSGTYSRYAPESRLVRRAQERSRCSRDFRHGLLTPRRSFIVRHPASGRG